MDADAHLAAVDSLVSIQKSQTNWKISAITFSIVEPFNEDRQVHFSLKGINGK
jgi:hypothetical protein